MSADGEHALDYRSLDKAGNLEPAKSAAVKLDATAPVNDPLDRSGRDRARSR